MKTCLVVIDGFGISSEITGNAIEQANMENFSKIKSESLISTSLAASGLSVGLPDGVMGNSEVGHLTIGSGLIIDTDIVKINKSISGRKNDFSILSTKLSSKSFVNICGLISDASVHSHIDHLFYIMKYLIENTLIIIFLQVHGLIV